MAYEAGTAFLQIVPSFQGVVTAIAEQATEWGEIAGQTFKTAFEAQVQNLNIGANLDVAKLEAELAALKSQGGGVEVPIDPELGQTDVAKVLSELDVVTADRTVQIDPSLGIGATAAYLAEVTALVGLSAAVGGAGAAAGGGGGGMGLIGMLLWGGGGIAGIGAGFGSIMSLAGFGLEHLVVTVLGLAASFAGALTGGILLATGALSIFAVGFVTDLGGIGQAAGDIKTVTTALTQYQTESQALNKVVPQSAAAQAALNTALAGFAPAARQAVLAASLTASQFHWLYDQATGTAEAIGANIINQALKVGEVFLPILGKFATINMGIIGKALQPLFQFLSTTGVSVFTDLEMIFTARLPTAMGVLVQGLELLIKTIGYLANQTTGGFMSVLLKDLTYLNTNAGFTKLTAGISTLIAMFYKWWALLKAVAKTIYDLFDNSKGLGTGIVTTLTQMLDKLDAWLTSTSGKASIGNLFTVHKNEVIALLNALVPLIAAFGALYLAISPPLVAAVTILTIGLSKLLDLMDSNKVTAYALGFALIAAKLGILTSILNGVTLGAFGKLTTAVGTWVATTYAGTLKVIGAYIATDAKIIASCATWLFWSLADAAGAAAAWVASAATSVAAWVATQAQFVASAAVVAAGWVASAATSVAAWLAASVEWVARLAVTTALMVADAALVTAGWLAAAAAASLAWFVAGGWIVVLIAAIVVAVVLAVAWIITHWEQIVTWFKALPGRIATIWDDITTGIKNWWNSSAEPWFAALPGRIVAALGDAKTILLQVGVDIVTGLWNGINSMTTWLKNLISGWAGDIVGWAKGVLGIKSPSTVFESMGVDSGTGYAKGLIGSTGLITAAGKSMLSGLNGALSVNASGAINIGNAVANSTNTRLDKLIALASAAPAQTGAAISTKVDSKLTNVVTQHARTVVTLQRQGAR
jgi:hypothetical protein